MSDAILTLEAGLASGFARVGQSNFDDLIAKYQTMVYRTAWRMLGDAAEAEDISQEVFLKLHSRLSEFEQQPNPSGWLYRVTVNQALDRIRRRRPTEEPEHLVSQAESPESSAIKQQQLDKLARLLQRLSPQERAALVLRDLEGLSGREVAEILNVTEETVRSAIFRAKEKLRQWMN
jgi:RNA polymerase sigma-70 factor (ECF subfamily)